MLKAAITGYSGFIGQNLVKKLNGLDISPVYVPRYTLYKPEELSRFFIDNPVDYIFNLASYGNSYDQTDDYSTIGANIAVLWNLLSTSQELDYQGFINFSSSSVMLPYDTMYSATKAGGERIVSAFVNKYQKPVVSVRPLTVIGKGEQGNHLIPTLIRSCQTEEAMMFVGEPVHDYIGVDDFLDGVMLVLEHAKELKGKHIDIGTGIKTTNETVKEIVEKVTDRKANIERTHSLRPYDSFDWVANPEVIQFLGWKQKQTVEEIIRGMV